MNAEERERVGRMIAAAVYVSPAHDPEEARAAGWLAEGLR